MRTNPKSATVIMLGTVIVTVASHDLAKDVLTGVLLTAPFTRRVSAMLQVDGRGPGDGSRVCCLQANHASPAIVRRLLGR